MKSQTSAHFQLLKFYCFKEISFITALTVFTFFNVFVSGEFLCSFTANLTGELSRRFVGIAFDFWFLPNSLLFLLLIFLMNNFDSFKRFGVQKRYLLFYNVTVSSRKNYLPEKNKQKFLMFKKRSKNDHF